MRLGFLLKYQTKIMSYGVYYLKFKAKVFAQPLKFKIINEAVNLKYLNIMVLFYLFIFFRVSFLCTAINIFKWDTHTSLFHFLHLSIPLSVCPSVAQHLSNHTSFEPIFWCRCVK